MTFEKTLKAALLGLTLAASPVAHSSWADSLRVVRTGTESVLSVPMNRAVVVESDRPFAELSIANPAIADISSLSDRTIYVLGKTPGTTTLTILDANGRLITNVDVRVAAEKGGRPDWGFRFFCANFFSAGDRAFFSKKSNPTPKKTQEK